MVILFLPPPINCSSYFHFLTGSVRFKEELSLRENGGLSKAIVMLSRIKKIHPLISWADLIQMAGALAVELSGGPKIDMLYGRLDYPRESYELRVISHCSYLH
jgi:catalase (peroxidase I)